jgi:elongation factor Ts
MEGKRALVQAAEEGASGDDALIARAKEILREAGKVAAGKRADRDTSAGAVAVARSGDAVAAVSLLSETDFVARNPEFLALAQKLADHFAANEPGDDPGSASIGGNSVKELIEAAVGKIRENIQLGAVVRLAGAGVGAYVHHDNAKAGLVVLSGGGNGKQELANKIGTQIVAFSPEYVTRDNVDQDRLSKELEIEKQRAIDDGKPAEIAEKIAQGKVSKDFLQQVVLLEQPWYAELSKKVSDVLKESGGDVSVVEFARIEAGKPATTAKA